jgi:hypothetical protein
MERYDDFEEALVALLGKDAGGLSASTVGHLKEVWSEEHTRWISATSVSLSPLATKVHVRLAQLGDQLLRYDEMISPSVQFFQECATLNHDVDFAAGGRRIVQSL